MFDCSRERGHAFTFQLGVGRVIKGWDDGVSKLSIGQRVKLLIPWADAYGEKGQPPRIPPRADLIFDVELKNINETLVEESMRYRKEEQARVSTGLGLGVGLGVGLGLGLEMAAAPFPRAHGAACCALPARSRSPARAAWPRAR